MPATLIIPEHIKTLDQLLGQDYQIELCGKSLVVECWIDGAMPRKGGVFVYGGVFEEDKELELCECHGQASRFVSEDTPDEQMYKIAISQMNRAIIRARRYLKERPNE